MPLERLIGPRLSPAFRIVMEIAQHAGSGMTVTRFQSLRFPSGTCQVWEFKPAWPPLDRPPVVVAVFFRRGRPEAWTPVAESGFDTAVRHYTELAAVHPAPVTPPAPPAPIRHGMPEGSPGIRLTALVHGEKLTLGGSPVAFTAPGGAP